MDSSKRLKRFEQLKSFLLAALKEETLKEETIKIPDEYSDTIAIVLTLTVDDTHPDHAVVLEGRSFNDIWRKTRMVWNADQGPPELIKIVKLAVDQAIFHCQNHQHKPCPTISNSV